MNMTKVLCLILALSFGMNVLAKEHKSDTIKSETIYFYKTAILYQAYGPVKRIKLKSKDPLKSVNCEKFDRTGMFMDAVGLQYDSLGYLRSFDIGWKIGKMEMREEGSVEYDTGCLPVSIHVKTNVFQRFDADFTYTYTDGVLTGKVVNYLMGKERGRLEYVYSDYECDEWGSWVKRKVKMMDFGEDQKKEELEFVETRAIEYY
ncbi:MAG: hypothetical protein J6C81_02095 [Muribaculaceae bacterium]|nr:hypothetical protein [Muribaculaceae bacterium]